MIKFNSTLLKDFKLVENVYTLDAQNIITCQYKGCNYKIENCIRGQGWIFGGYRGVHPPPPLPPNKKALQHPPPQQKF